MDGNLADKIISSTRRTVERRTREGQEAPKPDAAVSLRQARSQLERVCQMLLWPSPEVLESCEGLLASAARGLEAGRPGWQMAAGDRLAAEEARLVRRALAHAGRLLENAANFHGRWQRIRATITGGYRADGEPGQLRFEARRISVEG